MNPRATSFAIGCIFLLTAWPLPGQTPAINFLQPSAVAPGTTTELAIVGDKFSGATTLWTSFPVTAVAVPEKSDRTKAIFRITIPAGTPVGIGAIRLGTRTGLSGLRLLMVDPLTTVEATETNRTLTGAQRLDRQGAVDGDCPAEGYRYFKFEAGKGDRVSLEVVARRLGSPLDPLIRVLEAGGRELAYLDDTPALDGDVQMTFTAPARGVYTVELRDATYEGGPRHRYRLRYGKFPFGPLPFLTPPGNPPSTLETPLTEPNDRPDRALRVSLPAVVTGRFEKPKDQDWIEFSTARDERVLISGWSRGIGSPCDLALALFGADGNKITSVPVGERDPILFTNVIATAGIHRLRIAELNEIGGPGSFYRIELARQTPGFTLDVDAEQVSAVAGSNAVIKVTCGRRNYDGPISLTVAGLPTGYDGATGLIEEKKTDGELKLSLPSDAKPGAILTFRVLGRAITKDGVVEVTASTLTALRRTFPDLAYPPAALEGWIALGVRTADSTVDTPVTTKKKKK